jgi:large subunit ribosomal protein L17
MRHKKAHRKLGRTSAHRTAMLANLSVALITHGSIVTTLPRCKELRKFAERLITLARKNDLAGRRRAIAIMRDETAVAKLFSEVAPAFAASEKGGYTRITTIGHRHGDAAAMAKIELLPPEMIETT